MLALAPAHRKLGEVPRGSFQEGTERGGQVLFEEPQGWQRRRRRDPFYAVAAVCFMMAGLAGLTGLAGTTFPWPLVVVASTFLALVILALLVVAERKGWVQNTPFRVYAHGISLGRKEGPFLPFDGLYAVEDELTYKGKAPFTHLTFVDGTGLSLSYGALRSGDYVLLSKNYGKVKEILHAKFPARFMPRVAWASDALAFVTALPYIKGPVRVQAEVLALQRGLAEVDLRFLRENWREIAAHDGLGINTFKGRAMEAFEEDSGASK